jgi:hypothetical protein
MKKILFLMLFWSISFQASADTKAVIKPSLSDRGLLLDTNIRLSHEAKIKVAATIIPIQLRPYADVWPVLPEYYLSAKSEEFGRFTIGRHNGDFLLVDAGSFAVGQNDLIGDGNHLSSRSLVGFTQMTKYDFKFSYLLQRDVFYCSFAYLPETNSKHIRLMYADSLTPATDFKSSLSIVDNKIVAGFNLKYLGWILGGSYGGDFFTAGLGYSIGPFKTSLTYLSDTKDTVFGLQYNMNKHLAYFLQLSRTNGNSSNFLLGLRFSL